MGELFFEQPIGDAAVVTSVFNEKRSGNRRHKGIDYAAPKGTPVAASESGKAIRAASNDGGGYGNIIIINIINHTPLLERRTPNGQCQH